MGRSCCCHQFEIGKRLWFLKKLKRAGVSVDDLICITIKLSFDHCWNTRGITPVFQKNNLSHLEMFGVVRYKLLSVTLRAILHAAHWKYRY